MEMRKVISILAVLAVVFTTSCSNMAPLNEKGGAVTCEEGLCGTEEAKGMMLTNENGDPTITDPDHDEEHDKDDAYEAKEE